MFRIVEFAEGYDGKLRTVEVWFYALDTLPLFLAMSVWMFVWPPVVLNEPAPFANEAIASNYPMGTVNTSDPESVAGSPTKWMNGHQANLGYR